MNLNYIHPNSEIVSSVRVVDKHWWEEWLMRMVESNPDTNFFYTIESTDIWGDEKPIDHTCSCHARNQGPCIVCKDLGCEVWDFNDYAFGIVDRGE